jgi:hypothetical protein
VRVVSGGDPGVASKVTLVVFADAVHSAPNEAAL